MSDKDNVRRVQELRRSSAASPVDRSMTRSQEKRLAIQEFNEDGSCKGRCPYGTCGGGPEACGGCCSCMGGCEMANQPGPKEQMDSTWKPGEDRPCPECGEGYDDTLVETDCCDVLTFECMTIVIPDGNGDPDVTVCRRGFGCNQDGYL